MEAEIKNLIAEEAQILLDGFEGDLRRLAFYTCNVIEIAIFRRGYDFREVHGAMKVLGKEFVSTAIPEEFRTKITQAAFINIWAQLKNGSSKYVYQWTASDWEVYYDDLLDMRKQWLMFLVNQGDK